jgi:uncharacterized membrane protein YeaQ/YmgE (transglycosylase-associated protein family)
VIAWICFGIAAGMVALIFPYHRGAKGVLTNVSLGVLGAVGGGFLGRLIGLYPRVNHTSSFLVASAGAVVLLAVFHAVWMSRHRRHYAARTGPRPRSPEHESQRLR